MTNSGLAVFVILGMVIVGCENTQGDNGYSHNADIASQFGPHGAPINPITRAADSDNVGK